MTRQLTGADFETLDLANCDASLARSFLAAVNSETLGRKVYAAIDQKEKGHFDKAMRSISLIITSCIETLDARYVEV